MFKIGGDASSLSAGTRYEQTGVRRRIYENYLIFYRVTETRVEILHILNGAQDHETILFPQD